MSDDVLEPVRAKLTARQEAFVQEYVIDLNGTAAMIRAGYAAGSAGQEAYRLLNNPEIAARIEQAKAQRAQRTHMDQDAVLHEMSLLANSRLDWFLIDDHGQVALASHAPEGAMGAVASIKKKTKHFFGKGDAPDWTEYEVEIKLWDKPAPLKLMGRHIGLFPDKVEVTGANGGPLDVVTKIERRVVYPTQETP